MEKQINKQYKLILVDDEPHILTALGRELNNFTKSANICIVPFESGEECLEYLKKDSDDVFLVLSDLRLGGIQGGDLRVVKVHEKFPDIMLILLTAYSDMDGIQKAVSATLSSLLLKPWSQDMLLTEVRKAFEVYQIKMRNHSYQKAIRQQLEAAGEFQKKILCIDVPNLFYMDFQYLYQPTEATHCSGDYFDIIELDQQRTLLFIGDVSGHGIKPAFVTGIIKVLTRSSLVCKKGNDISASEIATKMNQSLCESLASNPDLVVSFQVIMVNALNNSVSVSNAGHPPSFIIRDNTAIPLSTEGPAMGFKKNVTYTEKSMALKKGDKIVMMTDGLLDSPSGKDTIETDVISDILVEAAGTNDFMNTFYNRVKALHPADTFSDDITMLTADYKGRP